MPGSVRNFMLLRFSLLGCLRHGSAFVGVKSPKPSMIGTSTTRTTRRYLSQDFESMIQAATSSANGIVVGGDFAGLAATFNPGDGSFIPVPVQLVPDALLEWGQEPKCLELLVSEEITEEKTMTRNTITVLPDTGCSIDNLETTKVDDTIDLSSKYGTETSIVGLQYEVENRNALRLESVFGMSNGYRMRVLLDIVPSESTFAVQSPLVLAFERRTNTVSSGGTIADGGGLDGRTVSMLLGEELRKQRTFVEEQPLDGYHENGDLKHISLPGNVGIAYGWLSETEWVVQTSHVHQGDRRVLSRQFSLTDSNLGEFGFDIESWSEEYVPGHL